MDLTKKERSKINALKRVAKDWPESLWLFSANGTLLVMKTKDGERVMDERGSVDQNYIVTTIHGIVNDGGDF